MLNEKIKAIRQKNVKGSVLFTVLVVMMVLIVFLMGTLGLATAANRRSKNAFTSSQAQYTARAVVEGTVSALRNEKKFKEAVDNQLITSPSMTIDGTNVQLPNDGSNWGTVDNVVIERCDPQHNFNETTQKWDEVSVLKITATVHSGTETQTYSTFITKTQSPYRTPTPSGTGATLENISTGTSAVITGPAVTTGVTTSAYTPPIPGSTIAGTPGGRPFTAAAASIGSAGAGTCPGVFGGMAMNMGVQWMLQNIPGLDIYGYRYDTSSTVKSGDNAANCFEAPISVNGNFSITGSGGRLIFPSGGTGVTVWGDLLYDNNLLVETGNADLSNPAKMNYTEIPYIYVEGALTLQKPLNASKNVPLNVIAGTIKTNNDATIGADLFLTNPDGVSEFKTMNAGNHTVLQAWSNALVTGTEYYGADASVHGMGNLYSLGSVSIIADNPSPVDGSVVIDGDLQLGNGANPGQELKIGGDLVVKGSITGSGKAVVTGTLYTTGGAGVGTVTAAAVADITTYQGFIANQKAYADMAAQYAPTGILDKLVANMSPKNRATTTGDTSVIGAYPWYMQKTWILGLFDDSVASGSGFYVDSRGEMRSRQIALTPQDEAKNYWDAISGLCYHDASILDGHTGVDVLAQVGGLGDFGRKVFTPSGPETYGIITSANGPIKGSLQIDLPAGMNTYWLVIDSDVTFEGRNDGGFESVDGGYIIFNDTDAAGNYDPNKILYIMIRGKNGMPVQQAQLTFNKGAGIITKYYENKLVLNSGSYQLGSSALLTSGVEVLQQPKIFMFADQWPYGENGGSYNPNGHYRMAVTNAGGTLMTCYMMTPGIDIVDYQKSQHIQSSNIFKSRFFYNGYPVVNKAGEQNGETIGWIGAVLSSGLNMSSGGPMVLLNYPITGEFPIIPPSTIPGETSALITQATEPPPVTTVSGVQAPSQVVTSQVTAAPGNTGGYDDPQWWEYWTQDGYDAY